MEAYANFIPGLVFITCIILISKFKKKNNKKGIIGTSIFLGVFLVGYGVYYLSSHGYFSTEEKVDTQKNTISFICSIGDVLGSEITGRCLGGKPLIIAERNYYDNPEQLALIERLKKNISVIGEVPRVDYIDINKKKEAYFAFHFDEMLRKHWYADLVISLEGLPDDMEKMKVWSKAANKRPKFVVYTDKPKKLKEYIEEDKISALVCRKPGDDSKMDETPPEDPKKAFKKHFILVTPENLAEMDAKYKGLFD